MTCKNNFLLIFSSFCFFSAQAFSTVEISGTLQVDQLRHLKQENKEASLSNGALLRKFSLSLFKELSPLWQIVAELDFSAKGSSLGPLFLKYSATKDIDLLLGQIPSPFCLENSNSSKWLPFLEKSSASSTFKPCLGPGAAMHYSYQYGTLKWGVRQPPYGWQADKNRDEIKSDLWGTSLRLTAFSKQSETKLLHLGASFSYQEIGDTLTFSTQGELQTREKEKLVATPEISARSYQVSAAEFAYLYQPFLLQAEFLSNYVSRREDKEALRFSAWHLQASFMLIGGAQSYNQKDGVFAKPQFVGAKGAWQLAGRFSQLDLNHKDIAGGCLKSMTSSLNWYISSSLKVALNLLRSSVEKPESKKIVIDSLSLRLQTLF